MLDKLLSNIESKSQEIKTDRDKMSAAIINSDFMEQVVNNAIEGKDSKPLFEKLYADAELEYQDEYEQISFMAEELALSKVDAIS